MLNTMHMSIGSPKGSNQLPSLSSHSFLSKSEFDYSNSRYGGATHLELGFSHLFDCEPKQQPIVELNIEIPKVVSAKVNAWLQNFLNENEIRATLFAFESNQSPSLDGVSTDLSTLVFNEI